MGASIAGAPLHDMELSLDEARAYAVAASNVQTRATVPANRAAA